MTNVDEKPTKLLLHACCGPCSLEPVRLLRESGIEPHLFYANPNIQPEDEYQKRLDTIKSWAQNENLTLAEEPYDTNVWEERVGHIGDKAYERFGVIAGVCEDTSTEDDVGNNLYSPPTHCKDADEARRSRCRACYRLRLEYAANYAAQNGFDELATTLTVSPYQYTDIIHEELERACACVGIHAHFEDYRPFYPEATRRARQAGMYRQNYCGCRFSQAEAMVERLARKRARDAGKLKLRAERAAQRQNESVAAAAKREMRAEYQAKQARKHEILKSLRQNSSSSV